MCSASQASSNLILIWLLIRLRIKNRRVGAPRPAVFSHASSLAAGRAAQRSEALAVARSDALGDVGQPGSTRRASVVAAVCALHARRALDKVVSVPLRAVGAERPSVRSVRIRAGTPRSLLRARLLACTFWSLRVGWLLLEACGDLGAKGKGQDDAKHYHYSARDCQGAEPDCHVGFEVGQHL
eukprot:6173184-Pleurochrysis_carterae.AAC.2